jgi:GH43 family beta-xylosidase
MTGTDSGISAFFSPVDDRRYANPISVRVPSDIDPATPGISRNPDPFVIRHRGTYYCYSSGDRSVPVLRSRDLCSWDYLGPALEEEAHWSYWAPCVIYDNGRFYMYYSSISLGETDDHLHFLKVAIAEKPEGPFAYVRTLFDKFSIDAHVVSDAAGRRLFYSVNDYMGSDQSRPGTVILEDRMQDLLTPSGNPKLAVWPTRDEEIFERDRFGDGRDWHTIEGGYYLRAQGREYLFYSGNAFTREHYFVDYAEKDAAGTWKKRIGAGKFSPLLHGDADVEGTGHNSIALAPNLVDHWLVYHGRDRGASSKASWEHRLLRMDPLCVKGDGLWTPGPSIGWRRAPELPGFQDNFDAGDGKLGPEWTTLGGDWSAESGAVLPSSASGIAAILLRREYEGYVLEVEASWEPQHSGGCYGVYAAYTSASEHLQVLFDTGRRQLALRSTTGGILLEEISAELGNDFSPTAFHLLRIERRGSHFVAAVDGVELASTIFACGPARVGLATLYCRARFDAFAVTGRLALERGTKEAATELASMRLLEADDSGSWRLVGDTIVLTRSSRGGSIAIADRWFAESRVSFTLSFINAERGRTIRILYDDGAARFCLYVSEMSARAEAISGGDATERDFSLPEDFRYDEPHRFVVLREAGRTSILLDDLFGWSADIAQRPGSLTIETGSDARLGDIEVVEISRERAE